MRRLSHVVGFDDAPFERTHRGNVPVIGAVYAGARLDGVLSGVVRRDGANATTVLAALVRDSRFSGHLQAVMLQGIALAGFNVVNIRALAAALGLPVVVVSRRRPDVDAIRRALLNHVPGGARKWSLIESAGAMEPVAGVWVQRAGIGASDTAALITRFAIHSRVPEPLRTAHLIAGGVGPGNSRQRV
ncbi:MAG TPA: DUF99 family protein [Burkholderiales bacterium]|nr:DUF99 family protein [Burkholderiales bacterium]